MTEIEKFEDQLKRGQWFSNFMKKIGAKLKFKKREHSTEEYEQILERQKQRQLKRAFNRGGFQLGKQSVAGAGCIFTLIGYAIGYGLHCLLVWFVWWILSEAFEKITYPTTAQVMLVAIVSLIGVLVLRGTLSKE